MIRLDQRHGVGVVALEGDLRGSDAVRAFRDAVRDAANAVETKTLVIDFSATRSIDSQGLEALLWSRACLRRGTGAVRLAGLDANCRTILEMTRLDERFEAHTDVQAALKASN